MAGVYLNPWKQANISVAQLGDSPMNTKNAFGLVAGDKFQRGAIVWKVVGIYDISVTRRQYTIQRADVDFTTTLVVDASEPCKPFKMV